MTFLKENCEGEVWNIKLLTFYECEITSKIVREEAAEKSAGELKKSCENISMIILHAP